MTGLTIRTGSAHLCTGDNSDKLNELICSFKLLRKYKAYIFILIKV